MNLTFRRIHLVCASTLTFLLTVGGAAGQSKIRAPLQPANERKPAPDFTLKDASGKTAKLQDYRGKVLLLDFWATWCTGCKEEIPWFSEFQRTYRAQGFAVVGVSVDEGGWKVVKPFLAQATVPYRMLLADDPTSRRYGITNLPDTFLLDRQGRIAAAYRAGLVEKDDVEANIKTILAKH
jgi:peroxiredoxin